MDTDSATRSRMQKCGDLSYLPKWYRVLKTFGVIFGHCCLGQWQEITGPTLLDLRARTNSNYEEISRVLSARSIGYFTGALFGTYLFCRFRKHTDILLASLYLIAAVSTAIQPLCHQLWLLGVFFTFQGIATGCSDPGVNITCVRLWGKNIGLPIHGLHFAFGVGSFIAPFLVAPYSLTSTGCNHAAENSSNSSNITELPPDLLVNSRIQIPYTIVAVLSFSAAVIFLAFYIDFVKNRFNPKILTAWSEKPNFKILSPAACGQGQLGFGTLMVICLGCYYMLVVGVERVYGKFLFSFACDGPLQFSNEESTLINSLFWGCFTLGRIFGGVASLFIPATGMVFVELLVSTGAAILLAVLASKAKISLWVGTCVFGLMLGPTFPSGINWFNHYIEMNEAIFCLIDLAAGLGGFWMQWLAGFMFQYITKHGIFYVVLGYSVGIVTTYVVALLAARKQGVKKHYQKTPSTLPLEEYPDGAFSVE